MSKYNDFCILRDIAAAHGLKLKGDRYKHGSAVHDELTQYTLIDRNGRGIVRDVVALDDVEASIREIAAMDGHDGLIPEIEA